MLVGRARVSRHGATSNPSASGQHRGRKSRRQLLSNLRINSNSKRGETCTTHPPTRWATSTTLTTYLFCSIPFAPNEAPAFCHRLDSNFSIRTYVGAIRNLATNKETFEVYVRPDGSSVSYVREIGKRISSSREDFNKRSCSDFFGEIKTCKQQTRRHGTSQD